MSKFQVFAMNVTQVTHLNDRRLYSIEIKCHWTKFISRHKYYQNALYFNFFSAWRGWILIYSCNKIIDYYLSLNDKPLFFLFEKIFQIFFHGCFVQNVPFFQNSFVLWIEAGHSCLKFMQWFKDDILTRRVLLLQNWLQPVLK